MLNTISPSWCIEYNPFPSSVWWSPPGPLGQSAPDVRDGNLSQHSANCRSCSPDILIVTKPPNFMHNEEPCILACVRAREGVCLCRSHQMDWKLLQAFNFPRAGNFFTLRCIDWSWKSEDSIKPLLSFYKVIALIQTLRNIKPCRAVPPLWTESVTLPAGVSESCSLNCVHQSFSKIPIPVRKTNSEGYVNMTLWRETNQTSRNVTCDILGDPSLPSSVVSTRKPRD